MIESVGDYFGCARLAGAPPPTPGIISRGLGSEGIGVLLAGLVARFSVKFVPETIGGEAEMSFVIPGLPGFFLLLVVLPIGAGLLVAMLTPVLKKMMQGVH